MPRKPGAKRVIFQVDGPDGTILAGEFSLAPGDWRSATHDGHSVTIRLMNPEPRAIDWELGLALLKDGTSYTEAAKTIGVSRSALTRRYPGYGWTHKQGGEYGYLVRQSGRIIK